MKFKKGDIVIIEKHGDFGIVDYMDEAFIEVLVPSPSEFPGEDSYRYVYSKREASEKLQGTTIEHVREELLDGVVTEWLRKKQSLLTKTTEKKENIDHPEYYGGGDNVYEAKKVIRAWDLNFSLGNCVKYLCRAGKKDGEDALKDLRKAAWYIQDQIRFLETGEE